MIEVQQLSKTYEDPDGNTVTAVSGASLTCRRGEVYGLLGPNGAGKTTTLRCLATILTPSAGGAVIAGHDLVKEPELVRRSIGFLSANTGLYAKLTPRETLEFFARLQGWAGSAMEDRVAEVLRLFAITEYADRPNDRLSTGMKQRVGLARAVVHDPPVIILDEPTTGLDPIVTRSVEEAVVSLAEAGKCILLSTHMLDQAEAICARVGVIGHGRVLAEGTIAELLEQTHTANLRGAFFALVQEPMIALEVIKTVFNKELREMLRDRRSLLVMFGLPLVLYPILALVIAGLGASKQKEFTEEVARVAVVNGADAPHLVGFMREKKAEFKLVETADFKSALAAGKINAVLTVPPKLEEDLLTAAATRPATRQAETEPAGPSIGIMVDRSRSNASFVEHKLDSLVEDYQRWIIEQRLAARHVSAEVLSGVPTTVTDIATGEQRLGRFLAVMLPLMLLMTGMLGALFPALNATTTERELGTLETLLVTPAGRLELLAAKGLLVLLSGLLTAALNMVSMSLVLWRAFSIIAPHGATFGISAGGLILAYVAAVPTILFFSTVVLIVGLVARNYREANSFASPVMLLTLVAGFVGMADPATTSAMMITPVVNTTLIIRDVLTERASAWHFFLAFVSSAIYATLMLSAAVRLFSNEQLVNPSWEPVSFSFARKKRNSPRRLPNVDGVLALFFVSLLLLLYISPSWLKWSVPASIVGTSTLIVALPALVWAFFGRYRWRETFKLYRPTAGQLLAGGMMGVGLIPVALWLNNLQSLFWKPGPDLSGKLIADALTVYPILLPVLAGIFAGTCEELLFRGPIQTAFLRRFPLWFGLGCVALMFALAHLDMHGVPIRFGLGLVLGWMVWRGHSIFPAMLAHGLFDAVQLGWFFWFSWQIHHGAGPATRAVSFVDPTTLIQLAAGLALASIGFLIFIRQPRR